MERNAEKNEAIRIGDFKDIEEQEKKKEVQERNGV